jgi:hypothetical protein
VNNVKPLPETPTKKCGCCGKDKPLSHFPPHYNWCRECLQKEFK